MLIVLTLAPRPVNLHVDSAKFTILHALSIGLILHSHLIHVLVLPAAFQFGKIVELAVVLIVALRVLCLHLLLSFLITDLYSEYFREEAHIFVLLFGLCAFLLEATHALCLWLVPLHFLSLIVDCRIIVGNRLLLVLSLVNHLAFVWHVDQHLILNLVLHVLIILLGQLRRLQNLVLLCVVLAILIESFLHLLPEEFIRLMMVLLNRQLGLWNLVCSAIIVLMSNLNRLLFGSVKVLLILILIVE